MGKLKKTEQLPSVFLGGFSDGARKSLLLVLLVFAFANDRDITFIISQQDFKVRWL